MWWNDLARYYQALIVSFLGLGPMMLFPAMLAAAVLHALGWATSTAQYGGPRQIAVDLAVLLLNYTATP